ncbi:trypsin-like peptidase domain-containing protein [Streptomyces pilosus]|uniref:Protease n=1 Tax=Streptomyces pilosus TaxID=28893 RepID=A0A918EY18_9ACTN|nr:trypsin-like peptidase domain-containing protein [Streptomyces pilosus]GGQ88949.1 protease [Streptomyces pilosus]
MNQGKPGPPGDEPTVRPEPPEGDFELPRPAARAAAPDEGDYELERPQPPAPALPAHGTAPAAAGPGAPDEGTAPLPTAADGADGTVAPGPGTAARTPAGAAADTSGTDEHPAGPAAARGGLSDAQGGPAFEEAGAGAGAGPAEGHVRPLHDPDPYSTPPYGEPGPWAPAPPVQHPGNTPAHGVPGAAPPPVMDAAPPPVMDATPPVPAPAHPDPAAAAPAATPAADPWGRYDPWAAAAAVTPLQQAEPVLMGREQRRGRTRRTLVAGALLLALVSGGVGGIVGAHLERNGGIGTVELPQAARNDAGRDPGSVAGIAAQALPSVVTLHVSGGGAAGTGTGFVLDERGHILTNDHVVQPAGDNGDITVTFHSGDTAEATVVGRDSGYDLAVVKVKGVRGLAPLPLGNSDNARVGDPVVAIGAPFDLAGTVTSGIISARERPITAGGEKGDGSDVSYVDALQTDAPINPGNSGGPLLDTEGRVIGINSAIRSADGSDDPDGGGRAGSIGLGFAIPINQGKRVAEELINTGKATHPVIGVTLDMEYGGDGARVAAEGSDGGPPVTTGGPGARAGIKAGDVITEVDGRRVHSGEELIVKTRAHRPGDRLELTVERDGKERKVSLVLGSSGGG